MTFPFTSISSIAEISGLCPRETHEIRPSLIPTAPLNLGAPVPSTIFAFLKRISTVIAIMPSPYLRTITKDFGLNVRYWECGVSRYHRFSSSAFRVGLPP